MGEIKKQGIINSILLYIGLIFSLLNGVVLFPQIIGAEIFGFTQWISSMAMFFNLIGGLGLPHIALRFFPHFKNKGQLHEGFLSFLLLFASLGIGLSMCVLYLFRPSLLSLFEENNSFFLLEKFYYLLYIIVSLKIYSTVLQAYTSSLLKTVVPVFLRELPKLLNTILLFGVFLDLINIDSFIILYVSKLFIIFIISLFYLDYLGELSFANPFIIIRQKIFKEIRSFSFFSILSNAGTVLINRIDILMISSILGFSSAGIYSIFFYMSSVIELPLKGLASIITPVIAQAWKDNDTNKINELYKKSTLILTICGTLIFIYILINLDNILHLLQKDIYQKGRYVTIWLGLAQLFAVSAGYNFYILLHSKFYKFDFYFRLLTGLTTIVSNYIMIRQFGLVGAAIATTFTIILINTFVSSFLYWKFKMQPFTFQIFKVILIGAFVLTFNYLIPIQSHFIIDGLLRSIVISILYVSAIIYFNISNDITKFTYQIGQKITNFLHK